MGEYVDYLKAWFASKPTSFNVSSFVQLFKILIRGMEELENKNALLQSQIDAQNSAIAVLENQMAVGVARIVKLESDVAILKG